MSRLIDVIAFFVGFIQAFHRKKDETILRGKIIYCDGIPVITNVHINEKRKTK